MAVENMRKWEEHKTDMKDWKEEGKIWKSDEDLKTEDCIKKSLRLTDL